MLIMSRLAVVHLSEVRFGEVGHLNKTSYIRTDPALL